MGMAPYHYRFLECFVPATHKYRISGTYCHDPSHCTIHTVSKADRTILVVIDLSKKLETLPFPVGTIHGATPTMHLGPTCQHYNVSMRMQDTGAQRVDTTPPQRVDSPEPQRVN